VITQTPVGQNTKAPPWTASAAGRHGLRTTPGSPYWQAPPSRQEEARCFAGPPCRGPRSVARRKLSCYIKPVGRGDSPADRSGPKRPARDGPKVRDDQGSFLLPSSNGLRRSGASRDGERASCPRERPVCWKSHANTGMKKPRSWLGIPGLIQTALEQSRASGVYPSPSRPATCR
jgi:hypothetical protein